MDSKAFDSGVKELRSFANGLQKDFFAVKEATASLWSNGQTEGQVNRLKLLKRQMYGRANFDLLKARVLNPVVKPWFDSLFVSQSIALCSFIAPNLRLNLINPFLNLQKLI